MPIWARKCGRDDNRNELIQEEREDSNCALKKLEYLVQVIHLGNDT